MDGKPNPRQELDGVLDRNLMGSGERARLLGNFEDYVTDIALAGQADAMDHLYTRVRDAEDARKAAVGLLEKQNLELVRLKAARERLRALHGQGFIAATPWCQCCCEPAPCPTVQALDD